MSVTIHDVAKHAGVSHTTVSWAIHDNPAISNATKEKVLKAVQELDYHPNYQARSLVRGKTNTIAVVASFFSSPFEMELLKGIEKSVIQQGIQYSITLFSTMQQNDKILKDIFYGKRADAVIMLSIKPSEEVCTIYKNSNFPFVVIDETAENSIEIQLDNFRGGYMATEYMIKSSKTKLGIVLGDIADLSQRERKRGFLQALSDNGIPFDDTFIFPIEDYYFEEGQIILKRILKKNLSIDGIFCAAGDLVATGIMLEARNQNITIPDQLAIVGYDDMPYSALICPPLTTIKQPLIQIGSAAYEAVLKLLETGSCEPAQMIFEPQLMIRNSV